MSSTELVTRVPSSAYHLLARCKAAARGEGVAFIRGSKPSNKGLNHAIEQERRQAISLKGSPYNSHGGGGTIPRDEFRSCLIVEARNQASKVMGEAQEVKYSDQLALVRIGEGNFEVKEAEDNILLVGVSVLHTEVEVGDRPRTRAVCSELFLFRAENLASLDVIRS